MNDRYPRDLPPHSDLASLARRLIDTEFPDPLSFIRKDPPILSLGSCFANHISDVLNAKGFDAFSVAMEEAENSTFATRLLLSTDDDRIINQLTQRELITLAALQERMRTCECAIITIGVAHVLISEDGKYVPYHSKTFTERKEAKAIMTTPDVNAKNVISIIDRIRSLSPKAKVVLTVSPIPLIKSFRPGGSAFVEDCVSKSIMRVAATMVMSQSIPDVFYWPSFEIVRWLTAHSGPVFGSDVELGSRHVNADVIDVVADLFIEKFTAPT